MALPDDLEEKVRSKAGVLYGARKGSLSRSVTKALSSWLSPDPELYVGTTPSGMSFEVPEKLVPDLMEILIDVLKPINVVYSYVQSEEEVEVKFPAELARSKSREMADVFLNSTFMAEVGTASLYTGGGGCFLLEANLNRKQRIFIAKKLLEKLDIKIELAKERFSVIVRGDMWRYHIEQNCKKDTGTLQNTHRALP
ncbi:MAG: hypothetical protein QXS27_05100 [Candidatus Jordarchaeaceae archaeon]